MPTGMRSVPGGLELQFGSKLEAAIAVDAGSYSVKTWSLRRSRNYGSKHYDVKDLEVAAAAVLCVSILVVLALIARRPRVGTWGVGIHLPADAPPADSVVHTGRLYTLLGRLEHLLGVGQHDASTGPERTHHEAFPCQSTLHPDTLCAVRRDSESIATKSLNLDLERLDILCTSPAHGPC